MDYNLTQAELGKRLGADETSVWNWENGYSRPTIRLTSKVIELLGFDPEASQPGILGRELAAYRRRQGLRQDDLARRLGIDPATLGRWERGETQPSSKLVMQLERLLQKPLTADPTVIRLLPGLGLAKG